MDFTTDNSTLWMWTDIDLALLHTVRNYVIICIIILMVIFDYVL